MNRSGVVLAGGRGARFGSDKARALFRGERLVDRAVAAIGPLVDEVLVARGTSDLAVAAATRMVDDPGRGPLGALLAAAQAARGEWLVVAPCDAPLLTTETYARLVENARQAAVFEVNGVPEPLVAVLKRKAVLLAARRVADPDAGPRALLPLLDVAFLTPTADEAAALRDADTPEALERLA
jgi:molybdopterin-guanine dinucleotide biosynthesis protein A